MSPDDGLPLEEGPTGEGVKSGHNAAFAGQRLGGELSHLVLDGD